jgi:ABC-2 type transport system ATP-binding protein
MDRGAIRVSGSPLELKQGLHGDILTLRISGDGGRDYTDYLRSLGEAKEVVRVAGDGYRMKLPRVETALPRIIANFAAKGLEISETSFTKPTLDEVFLEVTGRSMRDAEAN